MIIFLTVTRPTYSKYAETSMEIRGDLIRTMQFSLKEGRVGTWITFVNGEKLLVSETPETLRAGIEGRQQEVIDSHARAMLRGLETLPVLGGPLD